MYKAKYVHPTKETYWKTVWADSPNEADKLASKWLKKGYQVMVSKND